MIEIDCGRAQGRTRCVRKQMRRATQLESPAF